MTYNRAPKVSIGLPVYNGQNYVARAIESILSQTFEDFELIICDNCSSDETENICREFAANNRQIRYYRNERNIGAGPNYNRTFELSSGGEYFKWQAHDDLLSPTFLERCVEALDGKHDAVLCQSMVGLIDTDGKMVDEYDSPLQRAASTSPSERFGAIAVNTHMCTDFFALIRRSALKGSPLHGNYHGSDQVLLSVLGLRGRFLKLDEILFQNRTHPQRYSTGVSPHRRAGWFTTDVSQHVRFHLCRRFREHLRAVQQNVEQPAVRLRCYGHLFRWWFVDWNAARVIIDIATPIAPWLPRAVATMKHRLFGKRNLGFSWDRWMGTPP